MKVYQQGNFIITKARGGYLVYNTSKPFQNGHTHVSNFKTAKRILLLALHRQIPKGRNLYLLDSLLRISSDKDYKIKLNDRIFQIKCK